MEEKRKYTSTARKFLKVSNLYDLANLLKIPSYVLLYIAKTPEYRSFKVPKSSGGYRTIDAPSAIHKAIQKRINQYLQHVYLSIKPDQVHGFIIRPTKKESLINIRSNAEMHIGKEFVLNLDLKDFFHSITSERVRSVFMEDPFNFPKDISSLLAILTTWYNRLPMGAPTSPVISNLACLGLDQKLIALSEKHQYSYSRYVDDLTFSGSSKPDDLFVQELRNCIELGGFKVNNKKFRLQSKSMRQVVTGITVNDKPNLPRKHYRKLRAILYNWEQYGLERTVAKYYSHLPPPHTLMKHRFLASIRGKIEYFEYVRGPGDPLAYKLKEQYYNNRLSSL